MEELSATASADAGDLEEGNVRVNRHSRFSRVASVDFNTGKVDYKIWPAPQ